MEKKKEDKDTNLNAMWFAAGTLVAAACLQRASVVSLAEQWRVWVFLTLNLLLLAILFTSTTTGTIHNSTSAPSNEAIHEESNTETQHETIKRENRGNEERERDEDDDDEAAKLTSHPRLSKEELNERVEAFIATFRQQLVSDAKNRSKSRYSGGARQY
ncbi:Oligopeptide transport ATP-binding protein like [Actinidia chinensis var. chinensis]|uniref:Oligopeptide transport ATP-binding protein like n=1 Tax=Actinidia chinensis var. chinensis TaxID=1590841 RepID=A0A2R6RUL0_ACTCC|nr:Oligopeptide transport ATP-binding protein like [Actinidia chinensis var. chinensis]